MSSQQAHRLRLNTFDYLKKWLKDKKKVDKDDAVFEVMRVFMFSRQTADRYIKDLIQVGIAKTNDNHLVYVFDKGEDK